jgi:hypothetical protein
VHGEWQRFERAVSLLRAVAPRPRQLRRSRAGRPAPAWYRRLARVVRAVPVGAAARAAAIVLVAGLAM